MNDLKKTIYTMDAQKEIWSFLGLFESKKYVGDKLKTKYESINDEELDIRVNNIVYCLRQAREFFISAQQTSLLTSPLLLSYGMLNLIKAVVYFTKEQGSELNNLFHKHGIAVECKPSINSLGEVVVKFQKYGAYREFASVYEEPSFAGVEVSLKELLSQIPDLSELFTLIYKESPRVISLNPIEYGFSSEELYEDQYNFTINEIRKLESYLEGKGYVFDFGRSQVVVSRVASAEKSLEEIGLMIKSISGKPYLRTFPIINVKFLSLNEISIHYLLIFIYGMLSRYHSAIWGNYIDNDYSSEAEIIRKSIQVSSQRFVHLVLNILFEMEFEFRTSLESKEKSKHELIDYIYKELKEKMDRDLHSRMRSMGVK